MTDSKYTHLLVIVDRSGSMSSSASDMVGGLDTLFKDQAALDGKCLVDYVQFDDRYEVVFEDKPVDKAKAQLAPRGMTAMLDAVGKAVTNLGNKLAGMKEEDRPGLVQVIVATDGMENSSREWSAESVKSLIKQQEDKYNWDFVFLGANMDAVYTGGLYGFDPGKSMTYDTGNTTAVTASASAYVTRSRLGGAKGNAFSQDERDAQGV